MARQLQQINVVDPVASLAAARGVPSVSGSLQLWISEPPSATTTLRIRGGLALGHTGIGPQESFIADMASRIAEATQCVVVTADLFGAGHLLEAPEERNHHLRFLKEDRQRAVQRMAAALDCLSKHSAIDVQTPIGVVGFCLGGSVAIDFARCAASYQHNFQCAVSFHGVLDGGDDFPMTDLSEYDILALHGRMDPLTPPEKVESWQEDMSRRNANWELDVYGKAMHAFMRPDKVGEDHRRVGFQSDPVVAERAFQRAVAFIAESLDRRA